MLIDLKDAIVEFWGAFLGFCFAILLEFLLQRHEARKRAKTTMTNLRSELQSNMEILDLMAGDVAYPSPYILDNWRSACATGSIEDIVSDKHSNEVLRAFAAMEQANAIEFSLFIVYFLRDSEPLTDKFTALMKAAKESRELVRNKINLALAGNGSDDID